MRRLIVGVVGALFLAPFAQAQDRVVDVSSLPAIAKILQEEGYKAALKKSEAGEEFLESAAGGATFTIQMFGCEPAKGCTSAQFNSWYKKAPWFSTDVANRWNARNRFIKAAIDKDGDLSIYLDVSTLGKTTYANFADTIDWWAVMTAELAKFIEAERVAAEGK
ncbi:YbjN domain-containing protein [Sphingomonas sp. M1-B02]|uniref:YbjN domain-containing protein n=1 Tax=Sphingomonas sp. M1-B02 TaxID=3114300 RepID=UPI00223FB4B9|nr:YbjN domain-containing protein [Sphingomonas sp. S6-11]UZK67215.1 YbjN domain-containing protein [Sphingomonas sp. S6-11]